MLGRMLRGGIAILLVLATSGQRLLAAESPDFERDIAPLFVNHCLDCHQPNKRSGKLNVSTLASLVAGGEQGPALTPGNATGSLLVQRVAAGEMPPPDVKGHLPLSDAEKQLLRAWVAAGAPWPKDRELGIHEKPLDLEQARQFWSFQPIGRAAIPTAGDLNRVSNAIDAFVGKQLAAARLGFSPPATSPALLRRVALDVRGLPPTLDEQTEFLNDHSPD